MSRKVVWICDECKEEIIGEINPYKLITLEITEVIKNEKFNKKLVDRTFELCEKCLNKLIYEYQEDANVKSS